MRVYDDMGYIIAILLLVLVVPLIFMMLSRRTTTAGGLGAKPRDRGMTVSRPSSDQPTPPADLPPGNERRTPPG